MSSEAEIIEQSAEKAKYPITNWGEYDAALVKRGSLTLWMDEKTVGDNLETEG